MCYIVQHCPMIKSITFVSTLNQCAVQCSGVECRGVQCSAVQCSAVQYRGVPSVRTHFSSQTANSAGMVGRAGAVQRRDGRSRRSRT
jgi:hypothetical protein